MKEEIIKRYIDERLTCKDIARMLHLAPMFVSGVLVGAGITIRQASGRKPDPKKKAKKKR